MRVFVDTSALYALLDEDDANHEDARAWFSAEGADPSVILSTHAYVLVETTALVQRRLGADAVRVLLDAFIPSLSTLYVDRELHDRATAAYLGGLSSRGASFVDRVSFEMIRREALDAAFAFDADFRSEGFAVIPS